MAGVHVMTESNDRADGYLTVNQACELACISRSTFYRLLDDPDSGLAEVALRIPGLSRIRVPRQRFREWLESGRVRARKKSRITPC